MRIRRIQLPEDLDEMGEMIFETFQYPENPKWSVQEDEQEHFVQAIQTYKRI